MLNFKGFIPAVTVILMVLNWNLCYSCNQAEYEIGGECCPVCPQGSRVYKHCTGQSSTSCVPCVGLTYTDEPNGLTKCKPCTVCDQGLGLKTVRACTSSSDTVCGVLEGHYCINPYKGGCRAANKHTACKPGQFIQQPGTEYIDTVCEDCSDYSYSDGSFTSCKPHTDCESRGLVTVKAGDQAADSKCGEKSNTALTVIIIIIAIATSAAVIAAVTYRRRRRRKKITCTWIQPRIVVPKSPEVEDDDVTKTHRGAA